MGQYKFCIKEGIISTVRSTENGLANFVPRVPSQTGNVCRKNGREGRERPILTVGMNLFPTHYCAVHNQLYSPHCKVLHTHEKQAMFTSYAFIKQPVVASFPGSSPAFCRILYSM